MNIFRLAIELFLLYFLYKLIFDFIIPIAKTTSKVKKQFKDINEQMQEKMNQHQAQQNDAFNKTTTTIKPGPKSDDYIEFEEIK